MSKFEPTFTLHPVCDLFPEMDAEEYEQLKADIEKNGQIDPIIVTSKGEIIDGRHRYRACQSLGKRVKSTTRYIADDELLDFVISANLRRRHLTDSQRAAIAAEIATLKRGDPANLRSLTQAQAAKLMNVSERSVHTEVKVKEADPELHQQVKAGKASVHAAKQISRLPERSRQSAIDKIKAADKKTAKAVAKEAKANQKNKQIAPSAGNDVPIPGLIGDFATELELFKALMSNVIATFNGLQTILRDEHPLAAAHAFQLKAAFASIVSMDFEPLKKAAAGAVAAIDRVYPNNRDLDAADVEPSKNTHEVVS